MTVTRDVNRERQKSVYGGWFVELGPYEGSDREEEDLGKRGSKIKNFQKSERMDLLESDRSNDTTANNLYNE